MTATAQDAPPRRRGKRRPHPIIAALKRVRVSRHRSQATVARDIGTHQATIAKWELGLADPTLSQVEALAHDNGLRLALIPLQTP